MSITYRLPLSILLRLAFDGLTFRKRRFKQDALFCISTLNRSPRIFGVEDIPRHGPALIILNHYYRPGFHPWWLAMGISASLPQEAHWVMASEWTAPGKWYEPIKSGVSRFASSRIAHVYGFTTMPPMPPRPKDVEARARAVRSILSLVGKERDLVLCLAPEGADMPGGKLTMPPSGAGRFISLLVEKGMPIFPVGGWEDEDGVLCIHFGKQFDLGEPSGRTGEQRDRCVSDQVMRKVAELLPVGLRGEFA